MSYSFHPQAEAELIQAIEYYDEYEEGLGYDFAIEVYSAVERASSYPEVWPVLDGDIRRCLIKRFPFAVLYSGRGNEGIYVVAVMHLHRDPDYWKSRL
jgi:hypothetical protein